MEKNYIGEKNEIITKPYYIEVYFSTMHTKYLFLIDTNIEIHTGDQVVVETIRGIEIGDVIFIRKEIGKDLEYFDTNKFIRKANKEDLEQYAILKKEAIKAAFIFKNKIPKYNLSIKLVATEYTLDKKKLIFYFASEERVDFRDFVKDLASVFRVRIELRQIGVRDHAKLVGDCGTCGKSLCCKSFIGKFDSVSIKMIRDQNISVIPAKISGLCGRLKCCCSFEYKQYSESLEKFPEIAQKVRTPEGNGVVLSLNILTNQIFVNLANKGIIKFDLSEISFNHEEKKRLKAAAEKAISEQIKGEIIE